MLARAFLMTLAAAALGVSVTAGCSDAPPPSDSAPTTQIAAGSIVTTDARAVAAAPSAAPSSTPRRVSVQGIDLTGIGYDRGSPSAPVVVVDFSDFGCPFCGSFARETYPTIDREYVQTGKVFFKYVPFVMGMFPNGGDAARAAECAADQGGFWPMYERLYAAQSDWKRTGAPLPLFQRYAAAARLNAALFTSCYGGQPVNPRTAAANSAADRLGIRATPTFFINGHMLEGALPLPQFRQVLDRVAGEGR